MESNGVEQQGVPIWLNDTQQWISGLTKRTTCDDVIYAILHSFQDLDTDFADRYAIVEIWRGVERPLSGRTKILKVWNFWGEEQANVQLSMRSLDDYFLPSECSLRMRNGQIHRKGTRRRSRHSAQCRCQKKQSCSRCSRIRHLEKLVKRVVSQERKLQDLQERISDMDDLIDRHEHWIHERRVLQNGLDYVQRSYLKGQSNNNCGPTNAENADVTKLFADDFKLVFLDSSPNEMPEIVQVCEQIWQLDGQLSARWGDITSLTTELEQQAHGKGPELEDDDGTRMEIEKCRTQLFRLVTSHLTREHQELELDRKLAVCVETLRTQTFELAELNRQLESVDSSDTAVPGHLRSEFDVCSPGFTSSATSSPVTPTQTYSSSSPDTYTSHKNPPVIPKSHYNAYHHPDRYRGLPQQIQQPAGPHTRVFDHGISDASNQSHSTHSALASRQVLNPAIEDQNTVDFGENSNQTSVPFKSIHNSNSSYNMDQTYGRNVGSRNVNKNYPPCKSEHQVSPSRDTSYGSNGQSRTQKSVLSVIDSPVTQNDFYTVSHRKDQDSSKTKSNTSSDASKQTSNVMIHNPHSHINANDREMNETFPEYSRQNTRAVDSPHYQRNVLGYDNKESPRNSQAGCPPHPGQTVQDYSKSTNSFQTFRTSDGQESKDSTRQGSTNSRFQINPSTRTRADAGSFVTRANTDKWPDWTDARNYNPILSNGNDRPEMRGGSGAKRKADDVFAPTARVSPDGESGNDSNAREDNSKNNGLDFSGEYKHAGSNGQNSDLYVNKTQTGSSSSNPTCPPRNVYYNGGINSQQIFPSHHITNGGPNTGRKNNPPPFRQSRDASWPIQQSAGQNSSNQGYVPTHNGIYKSNLVTSSAHSSETRASLFSKQSRTVRFADRPEESISQHPRINPYRPPDQIQTKKPFVLHEPAQVRSKVGQFVPYPPTFGVNNSGFVLPGSWGTGGEHTSVDTTDSDTGLGSMHSDEQTVTLV
ncbi:uncharacterized protein LOC101846278 [Aplysia californica]|uniref:Uncharacterized protein LOC101846278 n=1 Tax=Aplysia californica TaxID=6500 RepID=A0ABM0JKS8_APLCA|nr:uncharacterized protein LOC101846278 [Aplysia californica]